MCHFKLSSVFLLLILCTFALSACASITTSNKATTASRDHEVSIITYNVGNSFALGRCPVISALLPCPKYKNLVEILQKEAAFQQADVILLQEVHVEGHEVDRALLNYLTKQHLHVAYAPARPGKDPSKGQMIISRHPINHKGFFRLPQVRRGVDRVALWADISIHGTLWRIYNVHLENKASPTSRTWQINKVLRHAAPAMKNNTPIILAGDFNTLQTRPPDAAFQHNPTILHTRQYLHSALQTYQSTTLYNLQLDWIFYRNLTLQHTHVLDFALSDHYPLTATFSTHIHSANTP